MDSDTSNLIQFKDHFEIINDEMFKVFNSRVPLVEEIGRHALLGHGKRLRPLIFVLSCELCSYQQEDVYQLSTIFEYIHTASLLHDDVLDNAEIRRNRPSANQVWGNHAAVLEGDFLVSKALAIAIRAGNIPFLAKITETTTQMTEGQILELAHTDDWEISKDLYLEIVTAKTAMLISTACACGAIISDAGSETADALTRFGLDAGIAFQLIDDLLDYTSSEEVFGKPVGKDLREGKVTLPFIYTLEQLAITEKNRLEDLFLKHQPTDDDYKDIIDLVRRNGALDRIRDEAQSYVDKAINSLDIFPDSTTKRDLAILSQHIIDRKK
ncbi:MAG: polyprenyl synthetase family protein [Deltaproteobacteria bacterium]|uniref:Polyprenyl synthetase family protein n=1 Tax=Candidatus Desulfacyla euxinica TaxID=2841693 RepID=A0A8J6T4V7_9DELT|nr:polyprenyl synthetase family protein [Candidatus Desulfacyla euxinica]